VNAGNQRTEFTYDGLSRMVSIRQLTNAVEASFRRFVWCDNEICEERDAAVAVTKRFFGQGMKLESGPVTGAFFYTRDHLGSVRELTDGSGTVRARYVYDPYGRRTRLSGDMETDFGFTGMLQASEAGLAISRFRAYDPGLGRWLSRDPLPKAELKEGPNLYAYVRNNPVNARDPLGLCCEREKAKLESQRALGQHECNLWRQDAVNSCAGATRRFPYPSSIQICQDAFRFADDLCTGAELGLKPYEDRLEFCQTYLTPCDEPPKPPNPPEPPDPPNPPGPPKPQPPGPDPMRCPLDH
jgi:RHS repeat-associated protein